MEPNQNSDLRTSRGQLAPEVSSSETLKANIIPPTRPKANPALNNAVDVIRNGERVILTDVNKEQINANRKLLASRLSKEEVVSYDAFAAALKANQELPGSYYAMVSVSDPSSPKVPVSIACGALTEQRTLIVGYAATDKKYAGQGIGRAVVNSLIENANTESQRRYGAGLSLVALEASKDSPSFWRNKIGCGKVTLVMQDGSTVDMKYMQPCVNINYETGMPNGEGLSDSMKIKFNGKSFNYPGVSETLMVKPEPGQPVTKEKILSAVIDFLDNYYFYEDRKAFSSDKAFANYQECRTGLIGAYQEQLSKAKEIKLT